MKQTLFFIYVLLKVIICVEAVQNITCTENEIYTNCLDPCVPSCSIPYQRHCEFLVCNEGCLCKDGYIKDRYSNGKCVPVTSCQEYCIPVQEYQECGSECPPTCENPNPSCEKNCNPGCFCKEGWIFEAVLELCVKECPFT